ncbi:hypothetical protein OC842_002743 [Tilletia horrida]|uniref:54S ribosomal protein L31, mitochondrial n=1 Tax=Tilletia horrida TaxID=155126 RepID=A0AAN6JRW8_9BASI|nr:hypothetical protein OC842_002743 [Tilletia horrida]KAK0554065.1 hypothetical protein OC844_006216 [Tilletia horrida]
MINGSSASSQLASRNRHSFELLFLDLTLTNAKMSAFRPTFVAMGGLLWKNPWRLSSSRKMRVRERLKNVDEVIDTLRRSQVSLAALDRALTLPKESEMEPRDKYTTFSKTSKGYRKSVHKVPKWTRLTLRENPRGF